MIWAVIFDMGGVLVHMHASNALLAAYDALLGLEPGSLRMRLYSGPAWEAVSKGEIALEDYWREVGEPFEASLPPEFLGYRDNFFRATLDLATVRLAWRLRSRHPIGLLSNATTILARDIATEPRFAGLFDAVVISAIEGYRKPEPEAFLIAAQRLNLPPDACVLIDDKERNTEAARAVGMHAVRYEHALQAEWALRAMGVRVD
ncbi:MAG TPA: HAD family phosphatase [Anaerolineae bacterium]|nr:HAD family phosphatase [Anaerolineae bacterium]HIQ12241.1 HAD family phosphatase [Caldilineales bacterium]